MYKEILKELGEQLDKQAANQEKLGLYIETIDKKLKTLQEDFNTFPVIKVQPIESAPSVIPPVAETPEPVFTSPYIKEVVEIGSIVENETRWKLYLAKFDDGLTRLFSVDKNGIVHSRGVNILSKEDTILTSKRIEIFTTIQDIPTGNQGLDPDPIGIVVLV